MRRAIGVALYVAAVAAYAAFGWLAGLALLTIALLRFALRVQRFRRALAPFTRCPGCRAEIPQYGQFDCSACHATTLSWIWRCRWCGAYAGFTSCQRCGLSVPNPAVRELEQ